MNEDKDCPVFDGNVESVIQDHRDRVRAGFKKYGVTTERTDLTLRDWLQHAYEECLDQAVYLKRAITGLDAQTKEKEDATKPSAE